MKHMVWRAVRGVLPTKETLQRRGIEVEWNCGVSNGNPETPWHLLLDCEVARDCWQEAGVSREVVKLKEEIESFNEWVMAVFKGGDERFIQRMVPLLWQSERNEI
ncbi:hypothetical protein LINPERPRIM_LOCUS30157 [Linum perenne]